MELVSEEGVAQYLRDDTIANRMADFSLPSDDRLTCQGWLQNSAPKRMIFARLYGALLEEGPRQHVLDVGGGLTCFTRRLAEQHAYDLVDLLAHDQIDHATQFETALKRRFVYVQDWLEFTPAAPYDLILANDLFPNVDQRLELFIEKYLPWSKELRLSLTYYPTPTFYLTRRVAADEILCVLAWNGEATARVIEKYLPRVVDADLSLFNRANRSVYANGRQVCLVTLRGDA